MSSAQNQALKVSLYGFVLSIPSQVRCTRDTRDTHRSLLFGCGFVKLIDLGHSLS